MNPTSNQSPTVQPIIASKKAPKKQRPLLKRSLIVLAAALVLSVAAWAAWEFLVPRVELKTFEGNGYSVSVPAEYEQLPSNGSYLFEEPGELGDETRSNVITQTSSYQTQGLSKERAIEQYDQLYSEESFSIMMQEAGDIEVRNFSVKSQTFDELDSRLVSFDSYKEGKKTRSTTIRVVFADEAMSTVSVNVHPGDSRLGWTVRRIVNSIEIPKS